MRYHVGIIVVLDTSVFVAAILGAPRGPSRQVLRACLTGKLKPLMGTTLFCEYEALLSRDELYQDAPLSAADREVLLDALMSVAAWTTIYFAWRPNLRDEADNHLVELAVAGGATAVITYNTKDLTNAELAFPGLRILTPEALLREMASWEP